MIRGTSWTDRCTMREGRRSAPPKAPINRPIADTVTRVTYVQLSLAGDIAVGMMAPANDFSDL